MKIGIIGAGNIALEHLKVLEFIKSIQISGIFSRTKKKSNYLSKKFKIKKVYDTLEEFMLDCEFDGIYILVSASEIFKITKKLIPYKIPLFVEKPAGLIPSETLKLSKIANKHKTLIQVGYNRRFYSIFSKCQKLISNKNDIKNIVIEGHERFWKIPKSTNKGVKKNWIYANSTHTIDLLRFFGGDIKKITNFKYNKSNEKFQNFTSVLNFKNGIIGQYQSNWNTPSGWSIKIYTNKYFINFIPLEKGYYVNKKFKKKLFIENKYDKKFKPGFYMQTKSFIKLIRNKKIQWPAVDLNEAYLTMKIAEKIKNNF